MRRCPRCGRLFGEAEKLCPDDRVSLVVATQITKGDVVGTYRIEAQIGEGGMGEVWRASDAKGKAVAIKFMSNSFLGKTSALARFEREIKAVQEVRHKNIVDIYEEGALPNGLPFYVMEFLEGKLLRDIFKERRLLSLKEILGLFKPLCRALHAGHEIGIIHRDLKPDNIFLVNGNPDEPKILDFGIAKLMTEVESLTKTGAMIGTPLYMSPEQCKGAKNVDRRADIYALGIILFELLTGRNPFQEPDDDPTTILSKQLLAVPPKLSTMVQGRSFHKELEKFVVKCLEKNPSKRPPTTLLFFEELLLLIGADAEKEDTSLLAKARPIYEVSVPFIGETPPPSQRSSGPIAPTLALPNNTATKAPTRSPLGLIGLVTTASLLLIGVYWFFVWGVPQKKVTPSTKQAIVINDSERDAQLRLATQHAQKRQWAEAKAAAEKANEPAKVSEYQAEIDATAQLASCREAINNKDPEKIFAGCSFSLTAFEKTLTYQENINTITEAKGLYKAIYFEPTRTSLDKAIKQASFNTDSARKQLTSVTKKILDLQSFVGTQDEEVAKLLTDFIEVSGKLFKTTPLPNRPPCTIESDPLCGITY